MSKALKIVLYICLIITLSGIAFISYRFWQLQSGRIIKLGDGRFMALSEYQKAFPRQDVIAPDKNKPEDVYNQFRAAMQQGDIETALLQIAERRRQQYRSILVKNLATYKQLPEFNKLIKVSSRDDLVQIEYQYLRDGVKYDLIFEKNLDGYWFIHGI